MTPRAALVVAALAAGRCRVACAGRGPACDHARRLLPHRRPGRRHLFASTASSSSRCRGRAASSARWTTPSSATTASRSGTPPARSLYSRGFDIGLRASGPRRPRPQGRTAPSATRCDSRRPPGPVQVVAAGAQRRRRPSRPSGSSRSTRPTCSSTARLRRSRAARDRAQRRAARQGRRAADRRRLHRRRNARRNSARMRERMVGGALPPRALQVAAQRLQRLGAVPAGGGIGHFAAVHRHPPSHRRSARPTTRSARNDTCSPSTIARCATWPPGRRTNSLTILANGKTYGGGGIFGDFSTVAVDSDWADYLFVHEFGHHFAALADEYYTSPVAYEPATRVVEPWEPNVTAHARGRPAEVARPVADEARRCRRRGPRRNSRPASATSRRVASRSAPRAGRKARCRRCSARSRRTRRACSARPRYAGQVGAFQGANYDARAYYRPQLDCVMFTRDEVPFCRVCQGALEHVIDLYAGQPDGTLRPRPARAASMSFRNYVFSFAESGPI